MREMSIKEIFEKAGRSSHSQKEYWNNVESLWRKYGQESLDAEEFMKVVDDVLIPNRQEISNGFQGYFAAYFAAALNQNKELKERKHYFSLLPTVYLTHHCVELFLKMVKIDAYNLMGFGNRDVDLMTMLIPTNIRDLSLGTHSISGLFGDTDVCSWFDCIDNGVERLKELSASYDQLCSLVQMKNPAEQARFPIDRDSYVYINRFNISEESVMQCTELVDKILGILTTSYISWHTQDDFVLIKKVFDKIKQNSGGTE